MLSNKVKRSREGDHDSKRDCLWNWPLGCLYVSYWVIFFGSVAFLIITSYLQEHRHHPAGKPAAHEASITPRK